MRLPIAVAAVAALALAVPAAAQPDPARLLGEAYERAHRNVGTEVRDYTLTVAAGAFRSQVYLSRNEESMSVQGQDPFGMGAFIVEMIQFIPSSPEYPLEMDAEDSQLAGVEYLGTDTVDGRPVHVLMAPGLEVRWGPGDTPDSTRVYVDAQTRQVLRVAAAGAHEPNDDAGPMSRGGHTAISITYSDYRETDGVTVPRRMRLEMRQRLELDEAERQDVRTQANAQLVEVQAEGGEGAASGAELIRHMLRIIEGEAVVIDAIVEEVRVNAGRPEWAY
jgi:hypothetical protein